KSVAAILFGRNHPFDCRAKISPRDRSDPTQCEARRLQQDWLSFSFSKLFLSLHAQTNQEKQYCHHPETRDEAENHAEPWWIFNQERYANHCHQSTNS